LCDRGLVIVLVRTSRSAPEVDSAALRPSPAELFVPARHRLANVDPSPVTVLRVRRRGRSRTSRSVEGATVERVLRPSPSLVGAAR